MKVTKYLNRNLALSDQLKNESQVANDTWQFLITSQMSPLARDRPFKLRNYLVLFMSNSSVSDTEKREEARLYTFPVLHGNFQLLREGNLREAAAH